MHQQRAGFSAGTHSSGRPCLLERGYLALALLFKRLITGDLRSDKRGHMAELDYHMAVFRSSHDGSNGSERRIR